MEEEIRDYIKHLHLLPAEVQSILKKYQGEGLLDTEEQMGKMADELEPHGFVFEYDICMELLHLRKIGVHNPAASTKAFRELCKKTPYNWEDSSWQHDAGDSFNTFMRGFIVKVWPPHTDFKNEKHNYSVTVHNADHEFLSERRYNTLDEVIKDLSDFNGFLEENHQNYIKDWIARQGFEPKSLDDLLHEHKSAKAFMSSKQEAEAISLLEWFDDVE